MGFFDGGFSGVMSGVGGALSGISNYFGNQSAMAFSKEQFEWQKKLAQNQLQWRVADAKKAGLHPMAALGLASSSFSPVGVSQSPYDFSFLGQMGQSADYAAAKAKDKEEQAEALALSRENARLQNENLQLQNQGLQQDNEFNQWRMNAAMSGVLQQALHSPAGASVNGRNGSMIDGQDDSVEIVPDEVIASGPSGSVTAGTHPLWTHGRSGDFVTPVLSGQLSDAVTENKEKHIGAEVSYALSAWNGSVKPPSSAFTRAEKARLASGKYRAYYYPLVGWRVEPAMTWDNFKRFVLGKFRTGYSEGGRVYSGRLK